MCTCARYYFYSRLGIHSSIEDWAFTSLASLRVGVACEPDDEFIDTQLGRSLGLNSFYPAELERQICRQIWQLLHPANGLG